VQDKVLAKKIEIKEMNLKKKVWKILYEKLT